ncbi:hypothetical protein K470DRAFT_219284 [Piedraia hortae CBS 480.64]|uniref:dihydroneopterin aldolase n=1 Tax=Piedraia hortae CBS 480.64 TaxID=1314780 RepID=A0A6A7BY11_9PEZI|nr:hypothetical protein K470DRAFT_219284 [Piedraia hortae CBS 480.64]
MEQSPTSCADKICIKQLQLLEGVIASDVWTRSARLQPAQVSLEITLREHSSSVAKTDTLDDSTVNYGSLAKQIRALSSAKPLDMLTQIESLAVGANVAKVEINLSLPQGSMNGEGVVIGCRTMSNEKSSRSLVCKLCNVKVMCIIGIHAHERKKKQPLIVTCSVWLDNRPESTSWAENWTLIEDTLVKIMEVSESQTLEALAHLTAAQISSFVGSNNTVRLRLEKPRAVPFAAASAVEVVQRSCV